MLAAHNCTANTVIYMDGVGVSVSIDDLEWGDVSNI